VRPPDRSPDVADSPEPPVDPGGAGASRSGVPPGVSVPIVRGEPGSARARGRWSRAITFALGAVVAVGALLAVLSSSGGIDDVLTALEHVSPGWVIAAIGATVVGYALLALHMRRLAAGRISIWQAARADLLLFGLGNVLPGSPAPGALLAAAELRRDRLPARRTRFVLAFTMWFNVRTLLGIGAIAFLVAFARQHPGVREAGLWWLAAVGLILALAASAALAARPATAEHTARLFARLRVKDPRPPPDVTRAGADAWHAEAKATVGSPHNRVVLVTLMAGSWLADAACLWLALASAGVRLDADVVVLAYVAGIVIASLPLLPGGIGAVEAAIPAVLHHFGAPLDAALAGTLVYRGISFLLPVGAGALILARTSLQRRGGHRDWTSDRPDSA
jgi:uncharacterized membrane protein YbhN (UPF0104 family)